MGNKKKAKKEKEVTSKVEAESPSTEKFPSLEEANNPEVRCESEERSTKSAEREKPRKYADIELKMKKKGQKKAPSVEKEVEEEPKYSKRKIMSNWERYEEPRQEDQLDQEEEIKGADYKQLLDFGGSGSHFQFQSETLWESEDSGAYDLSIDTAVLIKALNCIPLHERFKLQPRTLPDDIVQELKQEAYEVSKSYYESAGKKPPEFKEEMQETEPEEEVILQPQEDAITLEENKEVVSSIVQEEPSKPEVPKESSPSNENEIPRPQDARQKRERRPRRTQVTENPPQNVEPPSDNSPPQNVVQDTKPEIVETPPAQISSPSSKPVDENPMKEIVKEEKKVTPEKLEKVEAAEIPSSVETKPKPCVASLPRREKKQSQKPQENLDALLSLTKPVNRHEDESDEEAPSEEAPKKDVTVASIQPQTTTSASLEDWLDSILD